MQIKNRKNISIILFLSLFVFNLNLSAEEFDITAKEILIDNENKILVGKGSVQAIDSEGKRIYANKITYEKSREFLLAEGNVKIIDLSLVVFDIPYLYSIFSFPKDLTCFR